MTKMDLLKGLAWNEAIPGNMDELEASVVTITAHDRNDDLHVIGTGFVVGNCSGLLAAITAAHNLEHIRSLQRTRTSHPSALEMLLPNSSKIEFQNDRVLALSEFNGSPVVLRIEYSIHSKETDIAFLFFSKDANRPEIKSIFIDNRIPVVGEPIAVMAYAHTQAERHEIVPDDFMHTNVPKELENQIDAKYAFSRSPVFRIGTVTHVHAEGHVLSSGACVETTIPVSPGMSGAPAFYLSKPEGPMTAFGLISSSLQNTSKDDIEKSTSGQSIVSILPTPSRQVESGKVFELRLHR